MERGTVIAAIAIALISALLAYQSMRINQLAERLARLETHDPGMSESPGTEVREAKVRERLDRANERSKAQRRERWKEMWRQSMIDQINGFAAKNDIPPDRAKAIAGILEVHSEETRIRWEQVHDGSKSAQSARQETEAARKALRDQMVDQIGDEKWTALEARLELGRPVRR